MEFRPSALQSWMTGGTVAVALLNFWFAWGTGEDDPVYRWASAGLLVVGLLMCLSHMTVRVDADGLSRRRFRRKRFLAWAEIERIDAFGGWARIVPFQGRGFIVPTTAMRSGTTMLTSGRLRSALTNRGLPAPTGT